MAALLPPPSSTRALLAPSPTCAARLAARYALATRRPHTAAALLTHALWPHDTRVPTTTTTHAPSTASSSGDDSALTTDGSGSGGGRFARFLRMVNWRQASAPTAAASQSQQHQRDQLVLPELLPDAPPPPPPPTRLVNAAATAIGRDAALIEWATAEGLLAGLALTRHPSLWEATAGYLVERFGQVANTSPDASTTFTTGAAGTATFGAAAPAPSGRPRSSSTASAAPSLATSGSVSGAGTGSSGAGAISALPATISAASRTFDAVLRQLRDEGASDLADALYHDVHATRRAARIHPCQPQPAPGHPTHVRRGSDVTPRESERLAGGARPSLENTRRALEGAGASVDNDDAYT